MKNISFLMLLVSVVLVFSVAVFLLDQESKRSRFPGVGVQKPTDTVAELRKTEAALNQIERLQHLKDFSLNVSPDLLSAQDAQGRLEVARLSDESSVFPVMEEEKPAVVSHVDEVQPVSAPQQDYIASGYTAPITTSRLPEKSERERDVRDVIAEELPYDPHQVSFIYTSPDIKRAIINGEYVQEGDELRDGFHVASIRNDSVTITKDEKEYKLSVPRPLSVYSGSGGR